MTPIADMVQSMLVANVPADMVVLAVRTAEVVAQRSGGPPVAMVGDVGLNDLAARRARNAARMRTMRARVRAQAVKTQAVVSAAPTDTNSMECTAAHAAHAPLVPSFFLSSSSSSSESLEKERKKERASGARARAQVHALPHDWHVKPAHFELGRAANISGVEVTNLGDQLRDWAIGEGVLKADWDTYFKTWIRRKASRDHPPNPRLPLMTVVPQVSREKFDEDERRTKEIRAEFAAQLERERRAG